MSAATDPAPRGCPCPEGTPCRKPPGPALGAPARPHPSPSLGEGGLKGEGCGLRGHGRRPAQPAWTGALGTPAPPPGGFSPPYLLSNQAQSKEEHVVLEGICGPRQGANGRAAPPRLVPAPPPPASHGRQRILRARYRPRPPVGGSCSLLWYRGLSGSTRSWMDAFTGPCRQGRPGEAAAEPSPDPAGEPCCPLPVARSPHVPTRPAAAGRISAQPGTRWIPSVVLLSPVSRPAFNSPHRTADSVKQSL